MKKNKSKLKSILKSLLIGCGSLVVLVLAFVIWVAAFYYPRFGDETSPYHPFRSSEKQKMYLDAYDKRAEKWPVKSETFFLDTSFGQTYVRSSGPVNGSPVVLLHGANVTSLSWAPNIEVLSTDYRVYAVDNIYDVGRSIYKKQAKTEKDMVAWLDEVHDALDLEKGINLIGVSHGGFIAGRYALTHPQRLDSTVLIAPSATVLPLDREFLKHAILGMLPHRYFARETMVWLFEDLVSMGDEGLKTLEEEVDFLHLGKKCFKPLLLMTPTVMTDEELQTISVPMLFLVGEHEKLYSAAEAIQRLNEVAPQIKTELVHDAGHDLTIVQSEVVNEAILEFIHLGDMPGQVSNYRPEQ